MRCRLALSYVFAVVSSDLRGAVVLLVRNCQLERRSGLGRDTVDLFNFPF